jgi:glycyl-tRNA synthetase beta chain
VADAIFEHYLPRGAEERLPQGDLGALLGMADRVDQLVGIFSLGKEPTGTADPYGLRRAAIGLLRVTLDRSYRFDMLEALGRARALHGKGDPERVWQFLLGRLEVLLKEQAQPDSIQAALHTGSRDVVSLKMRLAALQTVREKNRAQFEAAASAFKRIANILSQAREKGIASVGFRSELLREAAEKELSAAKNALPVGDLLSEKEDYPGAWALLAEVRPAVDRFFDDVMVMDPDDALRDNRLALLRSLHELFAPLADFGKLQVEK